MATKSDTSVRDEPKTQEKETLLHLARSQPSQPSVESSRSTAKTGMPKAIIFIIGQEFCERFAFYGMRAVLMLYLTQELEVPRPTSKLIFHVFAALTYFTPIFGALLADLKAGKFKTILSLSVVYAIGCILLATTAINRLGLPQLALCITALVIIGAGSGGIKPCVAAFGGDQFASDQEHSREKFFAFFYFSINAGALLSMFLTPIFRVQVKCFGDDDCYPLAFGFPAMLMIVATILFVSGKRFYKIFPPQGSAVINFVKCSFHALCQKCRSSEKKTHWLKHAEDKYPPSFIGDCQSVWAIFFLFLPLPMFWSLFDQQGSAWTMQSSQMDGRLGNVMELHPDQMDSLNALLVVLFIPLFSFGIYPLFRKCHLLTRPLQRMTIGGLLAALSYVLAGLIHVIIEKDAPTLPNAGFTDIVFINTFPCKASITIKGHDFLVSDYDAYNYKEIATGNGTINGVLRLSGNDDLCNDEVVPFSINVEEKIAYTFAIGKIDNKVAFKTNIESRKRHPKGYPFIRYVYALKEPGGKIGMHSDSNTYTTETPGQFGITDYITPYANKMYTVCWFLSNQTNCDSASVKNNIYAPKGGFLTVVIVPEAQVFQVHTIVKEDSVHILWQIPQYILITAGEVMFSITGLSFAYSQAPFEMKSVMQAAWLLTIAFGNILVIIIDEIKMLVDIRKESISFFVYAIVMTLDMLIFAVIAYRYKYKTVRTPPTDAAVATEDTHI